MWHFRLPWWYSEKYLPWSTPKYFGRNLQAPGGICCLLPLKGRRGFCLSYVLSKSRLSSYQTTRSHIPDDDNLVIISDFSILSQFLFFKLANAFFFVSSCSPFTSFFVSIRRSVFFSFIVLRFLYTPISISNLQFLVFFLFPLRRVLILATSLLKPLSVIPSIRLYAVTTRELLNGFSLTLILDNFIKRRRINSIITYTEQF